MEEICRFRNKNRKDKPDKSEIEQINAAELKRQQRRAYRKKVWELTEQNKHLIPGIEKRSFRGYHIDHIIPITYGFKHNIAPEKIASIDNLRMLFHEDNLAKGAKLEVNKQIKIVY